MLSSSKLSRSYKCKIQVLLLLFLFHSTLFIYGQPEKYQLDLVGDSHWSKWNFTDLIAPYEGIDSWIQLKNTIWLGKKEKKLGLYGGILLANMFYRDKTKEPIFDWQNHLQFGGGLQYYPFYRAPKEWEKGLPNGGYRPSFGLRLFLWSGWRNYYQEIENSKREKMTWDVHAGADYYYESISKDKVLALSAWSNASFRHTNFSHKKYNVFLWTGNVRGGPKLPTRVIGDFFVNASIDWTIVSHCQCRWWENYVRFAGGLAWYPFIKKKGKVWSYLKRLSLYVDYYVFNHWIGDNPNHMLNKQFEVSQRDLRFGVNFATPNLFRKEQ